MAQNPPRRRTRRPARPAPARRAVRAAAGQRDPIEHVVLLMLENRSFDHILGCLPDVEGVGSNLPHQNHDTDGRVYTQAPGAARTVELDPMHETPDVLQQLDNTNGGFVANYAHRYPRTGPPERQQVMAYHPLGSLPALHDLGQSFTVCDHWFCSVPGPTWTNRLFALSGTSLGRVKMPTGVFNLNLHRYDQDTIFDRLKAARKRWRIYFGDFPLSLLFAHQRSLGMAKNYAGMAHFAHDVAAAAGDPRSFPEFVFIEPSYLWPGTNDDHPPHDVMDGQQLIADVYNALRANEGLWLSTLLIVAYDEHGGFYDHVAPPAAVPPDGHRQEYTFDRLGVRVPAVLASPWVPQRVEPSVFDHTSVLRYLIDKWSLGELGRRTAEATSIGVALRPGLPPRDDTPPAISGRPAVRRAPRRRAAARAVVPEALNDNQKAILAFSQALERDTAGPATAKVARSMRLMRGPRDQFAVARTRAEQFLKQRGARL